jgi:Tetratricopeptide repeat
MGRLPGLPTEAADRVLARLAGVSLVTFSMDGTTVTAHRLVMRVIRDSLAAASRLTVTCQAAARVLDNQAGLLSERWHQDRTAARDQVEQITALAEAADRCPADEDLDRAMIRLRWWAVWVLNRLGDSPGQAVTLGERLVADQERLLGPDHPDTLASRNNLGEAHRDAGRTAEAIPCTSRPWPPASACWAPTTPTP